jgi:uncharacterized protein YneF (UPF0154 family)
MEKYIDIKDLAGEVFLIILFLAIAAGAFIAHKIIEKRREK